MDKQTKIPETEKRQLRYDFTAVEIHDLSLQLANENRKLVNLENEQKAVQSQYASKVKVAKAEIGKLSNLVADGYEIRDIECDVEFHKPTKGMKTFTRKDNGRTFTEKMEAWEWNLFNQAEEEEGSTDSVDTVDGEAEVVDSDEPKLIGYES